MPIEVKTWACRFRCRYRNSSRKAVEEHEERCFTNPEKRACKTCKHDQRSRGGWDGSCFYDDEAWCEADARPSDKNAISGCPAWEPKEGRKA